ncbi:GyrI-like domain-containing protein [Lysinibacter cavernae]|uniref:GyrI-like small molecule binding domain-containing protein n=1 Tax=Lysinibacter cavernae TaxID=1640652 RepID=A0A7X5QZ45_9MICO|nr:GyrI-like domain-containing protein [Lysinibacter cavernae]NIH52442.1 hypothetical protein [Lysinibacter cavernae]
MSSTPAKIDLKKELKRYFSAPAKDFELVELGPVAYLMIDGEGNPNTAPAYISAVEALYAASFTIKFASKKLLGRDYVVAPLEGLWTADDPASFTKGAKDDWRWTMMIMQPDWITADLAAEGIAAAKAKKKLDALDQLRFETLTEGLCAQILHTGSYDDEAPTLDRLHNEFMPANGLTFNGLHHEVYLGDPRKVAPEKLKTVLRQPVRPS